MLRKDAASHPLEVLSPFHSITNAHLLPLSELGFVDQLERSASLAMLVLCLAFAHAWYFSSSRTPSSAPESPRPKFLRTSLSAPPLPLIGLSLGLLALSYSFGHRHLPRLSDTLSSKEPFERWEHAALALPETIGLYRLRDPGTEIYGPDPDRLSKLESRKDITQWLMSEEQRVALIRRRSFPAIFQEHRARKKALHVLDWRHPEFKLIANFSPDTLPEAYERHHPLESIVLDDAPPLEHPTLLRFDDFVEIVGWQLDGPIRRGDSITLHLAFKVLRRLPSNAQLYARLQQGRISRINGPAHDFTGGEYPPQHWRKGDYIHHRFRFEIPYLQTLPGPHKLIVGIKRGESSNVPISIPEGKTGEHGVVVRGKKRTFAALGEVEVD